MGYNEGYIEGYNEGYNEGLEVKSKKMGTYNEAFVLEKSAEEATNIN